MGFDRRAFLKFMGIAALTPLVNSCSIPNLSFESPNQRYIKPNSNFKFDPVMATSQDELVLPKGFSYNIIRSWGDNIGINPLNNEPLSFGFNNDFTCFFPLKNNQIVYPFNHFSQNNDSTNQANSSIEEGLLWVNHESVDKRYIKKEEDQRKAVGGSLFKVKRDSNGIWQYDQSSNKSNPYFNRRFDANTSIEMTGPVAKLYPKVTGTLANCSGGQTPWLTLLTCEENYHDYAKDYKWKNFNQEEYGWVVEIDPYNPESTAKKRSALGRFAHENAALTSSKSGKVVVYMGDDKEDEHIYKFVSEEKINTKAREANFDLLSKGKLYVAKLNKKSKEAKQSSSKQGSGKWELLSVENIKLRNRFGNQANMLIHTREAAKLLKATKLDRPEDLEISPYDGSIFVALTNNVKKLNAYGSILRIVEKNNNHESLEFTYEKFLMGGPKSGLSCPDNLAFDNKGNLWVTTDIKGRFLNLGPYQFHGNNSLFVIPMFGENAGQPTRFASAPRGAELTGPWFSPDFKTLFLSVQHPGEDGLKSTWPHKDKTPKPSVVAINGF